MKILTIVGTRPEAIKLAPVLRELHKRRDVQSLVCATAQHREMLDDVLTLFNIAPDYDLDVMASNQTPAQVSAAVLLRLDPILEKERPDWVIVQGDTTTAAAGGLCAFYRRIKVAHVEAGLRTRDKWRPFPEEINRRIATVVSDLHFAPTPRAKRNLLEEGVDEARVVVTGNPVIDALDWAVQLPPPRDIQSLRSKAETSERSVILVTAHRRENWGSPLENICSALREMAETRTDVHIVYPVHPNPNVDEAVRRLLGDAQNVTLLPPVDYLTLVHLMKAAKLVVTDSGGIQEEAPSLGKPVLVLREITERPEAVESGTVKIIGTKRTAVVREVTRLLDDSVEYHRMSRAVNPYGDGKAGGRIAASLLGEPYTPFAPADSPENPATMAAPIEKTLVEELASVL